MEQDEFIELVGRLTEEAARSPASYRLKVLVVVVLGYLGVLGMIALALAATIGTLVLLVWIHALWLLNIVWIPALFGFVILKSLWIRVPPPQGMRLEAASSPDLFEEIEAVCARMAVPRLHRVLATQEFNAGVRRVPVLGLLGWYRSYLVLGLPLLQSLSREQFRAVLAHELAHLSRRHGRFANQVYAMRTTWTLTRVELEQVGHWGQVLVRGFLEWYAPLLDAYGFVLARAHEYEADRAGVALTSPDVAASALARIEVASRFAAEAYWQAVFAQARTEPEPPREVFAGLGRALERPVAPERAAAWLATARAQRMSRGVSPMMRTWSPGKPALSRRLPR